MTIEHRLLEPYDGTQLRARDSETGRFTIHFFTHEEVASPEFKQHLAEMKELLAARLYYDHQEALHGDPP